MARNIAIIPARGGSKRLPRKNILPINNQPLISYPIKAALECGLFEEVIVSTEDDEISNIAARYGAKVVSRPAKLAQDRSTVVDVCSHLLGLAEYAAVDNFCCLYATAFQVKPNDLIDSFLLLNEAPKADYVMGVSSYNYHPVQALVTKDGFLQSMWSEYNQMQSQQYPEMVVSNGTLYWARVDSFRHDKTFYGAKLKGYLLHSIDIDTQEDYELAISYANRTQLS